jgi:ATP-dependent Lhr-like helicase
VDTTAIATLPELAREVFARTWGEPTPAQRLAWSALAAGRSALVAAPTGSGKTLAAFYAFLARMVEIAPAAPGVEVVYVSPLKALASDIEKNLRAPLHALAEAHRAAGRTPVPVPVAVRTGDTPQKERAAFARRPPRVLVTTPESLYLVLTSPRARQALATVRAVIVDEIHALLDSKRGAHLALSLERLERLTGRPLQRVGLSATAHLEATAAWLAGRDDAGRPRPLDVLDDGGRKRLDLRVAWGGEGVLAGPGGLWPHVARELVALIAQHRSTLVFCNSRRLAERMTAMINEAAGGRALAQAHHGAMSREKRHEIEAELKAGALPALVATGSLELGIDVGAIELVVQLGSPKSVARGLQRVGRAGHLVGATAKGRVIGTYKGELLEAAAVARGMLARELEPARPPEGALDVLAQQIAAEVAAAPDPVPLGDLYGAFTRSWAYRRLAWTDFVAVVEMLAGRYETPLLRDVRPRLDWDRRRNLLGPLPGTRARATARPGTIPDRGLYRVELAGDRTRLGELDEEFVFESRVNDVFLLGASAWRIRTIGRDRVQVEPAAPGEPARMPFWRGEGLGRGAALGRRVGALARELGERLAADPRGAARWVAETCALEDGAAAALCEHLERQIAATGVVPDDRTVVLEQFEDEEGGARVALLSPWGGRLHQAWAIALAAEARRRLGLDLPFAAGDEGVVFRVTDGDAADALLAAGSWLRAADVPALLEREIDGTPLYAALFREAAQRALVLPAGRGGRAPLWLARLRAADLEQLMRGHEDFPVAREARREALEDVLEVRGLVELLGAVERGDARVVAVKRSLPSPMAAQLTFAFTFAFLYEGDAPRVERRARALAAGRGVAVELLPPEELEDLLEPDAVAALEARRQHTADGTRARTPEELVEILRRLGELTGDELAARHEGDSAGALAELARAGRALRLAFPDGPRWIAGEDDELWREARGEDAAGERARREIVARFAAARGPFTTADVAARLGLAPAMCEVALEQLAADGLVARGRFVRAGGAETWCDRRNLAELHRRTLSILRDRGAPATTAQLASFLIARHRAGTVAGAAALLAGVRAPVESLERDLVWRRVPGYQPALLDAACASGEVAWFMDGARVALAPRAELPAWAPAPDPAAPLDPAEQAVLAALDARGAQFAAELLAAARLDVATLFRAVWSLARRGLVANDAYEALRRAAALDFEPASADLELANTVDALRRARRARPSPWVGRFSRLAGAAGALAPDERAAVQAHGLLRRYGVVGKALADAEPGLEPWPALEDALRRLELRGELTRGWFADGLGAYQVALPAAVDDLRAPRDPAALALVAALDPASPWGTLAPLPGGLRLARVPSTHLVLRGGAPLLLVEGHGRRLTVVTADGAPRPDDDTLVAALRLLARLLAPPAPLRAVRHLAVHELDGAPAAARAALFQRAGFTRDDDRMVMGALEAGRVAAASEGDLGQ